MQPIPLQAAPTDLAKLLGGAMEALVHQAKQGEISLHVEADDDLPIIQADSEKIAWAVTTLADGSPAFTANVGDKFDAWDMQLTADYMPNSFMTFRVEYNHRAASIPYFAGHDGMTPCINGVCANTGAPGSWPGGADRAAPDLSYDENRLTLAMMMRF